MLYELHIDLIVLKSHSALTQSLASTNLIGEIGSGYPTNTW
jgi:hypothetical protein